MFSRRVRGRDFTERLTVPLLKMDDSTEPAGLLEL